MARQRACELAREQIARIRERSRRAVERFEREIEPAAARAREDGSAFPAHIAEFGHELHEFIVDWCARLERAEGVEPFLFSPGPSQGGSRESHH